METLLALLKETGIPFAYDHFAEGESPEPPFVCYLLPQSNNFAADGMVYFKASGVKIELYTDTKDPSVEKKLEDALDKRRIFYNKGMVAKAMDGVAAGPSVSPCMSAGRC